ncbi:MAG TPA: CHRD domain-containing protein [Stellaceae bacterium]|nr:CHRD domain-containing protein [Stellaceae bacterium]
MQKYGKFTVGLAFAAGLALAGCAHEEMKHDAMMHGGLSAHLTGGQEVPPNTTTGVGDAVFTVSADKKSVSWKVTWSGLTGDALAAHIHGPAAPGANAGVVVNLAPNGIKNPLEGSAPITEAQLEDLMAGRDYVNVHSAANKGGEIRGQITAK